MRCIIKSMSNWLFLISNIEPTCSTRFTFEKLLSISAASNFTDQTSQLLEVILKEQKEAVKVFGFLVTFFEYLNQFSFINTALSHDKQVISNIFQQNCNIAKVHIVYTCFCPEKRFGRGSESWREDKRSLLLT